MFIVQALDMLSVVRQSLVVGPEQQSKEAGTHKNANLAQRKPSVHPLADAGT